MVHNIIISIIYYLQFYFVTPPDFENCFDEIVNNKWTSMINRY